MPTEPNEKEPAVSTETSKTIKDGQAMIEQKKEIDRQEGKDAEKEEAKDASQWRKEG